MLTKEEIMNIFKIELPYLKAIFGVKRIGLFGSYSKGTQREDSNTDLVMEFEKPIGLEFIGLSDYIEKMQKISKRASFMSKRGDI